MSILMSVQAKIDFYVFIFADFGKTRREIFYFIRNACIVMLEFALNIRLVVQSRYQIILSYLLLYQIIRKNIIIDMGKSVASHLLDLFLPNVHTFLSIMTNRKIFYILLVEVAVDIDTVASASWLLGYLLTVLHYLLEAEVKCGVLHTS